MALAHVSKHTLTFTKREIKRNPYNRVYTTRGEHTWPPRVVRVQPRVDGSVGAGHADETDADKSCCRRTPPMHRSLL